MKKLLIAVLVSVSLAAISVDSRTFQRQPAPIVYKITELPRYGRRKPLKNRYEPRYGLA